MTTTKLHIRWMIRKDMEEVLAIERGCFDIPWRAEDFVKVLRQRNAIGMVCEHGRSHKVAGFMLYELHKTRLHLLNFAVDPRYHRTGIGSQMVQKLKDKLSAQRRVSITLEVRETNLAAQLFFRDMGFVATSVLKRFYDNSDEDAIFFAHHFEDET